MLALDMLAGTQVSSSLERALGVRHADGVGYHGGEQTPEEEEKEGAVAASVWRLGGEEERPGKWGKDQEHVWLGGLEKSVPRRGSHVSALQSLGG